MVAINPPSPHMTHKQETVIITGFTQGLGWHMAKEFILLGYNIALVGRTPATAQSCYEELRKLASKSQKVLPFVADISDYESVLSCVTDITDSFETIDILINNAGILGPIGNLESLSMSEWCETVHTNLFGSVYFAYAILPKMKTQRSGKIIQLSGGGATSPMPNFTAYAASKAAVVRFAESLSLEVADFGIDINCIAPGALNTQMLDKVLAAGPDQVGSSYYTRSQTQLRTGGAGFSDAVDLAVFLASSESNGITGKLIAAKWDNWTNFSSNIEKLQSSDVLTLRRITGQDRNMDEISKPF